MTAILFIALQIVLIAGGGSSYVHNLWAQDRKSKMTSVQQVEQLVRISREFGREIASGKEARQIYRIGEFYKSADETLARNGFAPNRKPGQRSALRRIA